MSNLIYEGLRGVARLNTSLPVARLSEWSMAFHACALPCVEGFD